MVLSGKKVGKHYPEPIRETFMVEKTGLLSSKCFNKGSAIKSYFSLLKDNLCSLFQLIFSMSPFVSSVIGCAILKSF